MKIYKRINTLLGWGVFLIASITKPLTAAGVMLLADRGEVQLSDPVRKFIPEFTEGDRKLITVRHLLTHTSGLPDQLPENIELRKRHAPLEEFVERAIRTPLLFEPGQEVRYQSMGFLLAAEVVQRITQHPFRDYLREELFLPLEMRNSELGLGHLVHEAPRSGERVGIDQQASVLARLERHDHPARH